jgi:hypothetical protein
VLKFQTNSWFAAIVHGEHDQATILCGKIDEQISGVLLLPVSLIFTLKALIHCAI